MNNIQKITIGNITINNPKQIALDGAVIWKAETTLPTLPKPVIQSGCSDTYTESQCPVTVYVTLQGYADIFDAEGNYTLEFDTGEFIDSGIHDSDTFYFELDGVGTYDIIFECIDGYTWADGSTDDIYVTFEITDSVEPVNLVITSDSYETEIDEIQSDDIITYVRAFGDIEYYVRYSDDTSSDTRYYSFEVTGEEGEEVSIGIVDGETGLTAEHSIMLQV